MLLELSSLGLFFAKPLQSQSINPTERQSDLTNSLCDLGSLPKHPGNYKVRGVRFLQFNQYEKALECFKQALEDPRGAKDPEVWNGYGIALGKLKKYEEAITAYEQSLAILAGGDLVDRVYRPDSLTLNRLKPEDYYIFWFNKGITLYEIKRYSDAMLAVDQALKLKPEFQPAIDLLNLIKERLAT
jgi:superkiller protein 3